MSKHILFIYHSNAGQTQRAVEILAKGFLEGCAELRLSKAKISCETEYPFPWPFFQFFSIFPDCVRGRAPKIQLKWEQKCEGEVDLVVLAGPVWFLSPSLPIQGFFQSESRILIQGKPVVSLLTSRNMWVSAYQQIRELSHSAGARIVDNIVLMDCAPPWTTFITTPVWMLTGRKKMLGFPEAGIQAVDFERLKGLGFELARQRENWPTGLGFLEGKNSVALAEKYILPEMVVKTMLFKPWSAWIHKAEALGSGSKKFWVYCFILSLVGSILVLIPSILFAKIFLKIFAKKFLRQLKAQVLLPYNVSE